MATSKLELAVGTGKWDAGLKKAQQSLNSFTNAQGGFQKALDTENQKMGQFVKMMGKIDSTASTAKGQMNDYKRVLEQLTADYNKMSEAQKKSIGTDYLQTIESLKQKFQQAKQQVDDFNRSIGNIKTPEIKSNIGGGLFGGGKLDGMLQVFGGNLMTKGFDMAVGAVTSFASEIGDCVKQGVELAKQGEGIRIAFERIGRGDLLDGLRQATHGTITDLELMKAAVRFDDFKLPLDQLGTMLAFAQQKAKDTGQSFDYMVDSIVTGLGRQSPKILDNLGLSITEIHQKTKETGDMTKAVGQIIREQMAKAGDYVETAADRAAQANVSLQNKMEELGRKFAPVEEASSHLWTSMKIGILDIIGGPLATLLNQLTEAGRIRNEMQNMGGSESVNKQLGALRIAKGRGATGYMTSRYNQDIADYQKQISDLDFKIAAFGKGRDSIERGHIERLKEQKAAVQALMAEYKQGAQQIMKATKAANASVAGGTTTPTTSTKSGNMVSIEDKMAQMWERAFMKSVSMSDSFVNPNESEPSEIWKALSQESEVALSPLQKLREELAYLTKSLDEAADPQAYQDIKKVIEGKQRQIDDFTGETKKTKITDKTADELAKIGGDISKVTNSVGSIFSGLQQMGIEIPNEIQSVIGVVNGISTILIGISTLLTLIDAKQDVQTFASIIPFYARGGVVPHAATGYFVGGNRRSGDTTHIMANAGELVLNESSQNSLAADIMQARGLIESINMLYGIGNPMLSMSTQSALGGQMRDGGIGSIKLEAYVKGEQLHLVHNRFLRRSGQGEIVTWK